MGHSKWRKLTSLVVIPSILLQGGSSRMVMPLGSMTPLECHYKKKGELMSVATHTFFRPTFFIGFILPRRLSKDITGEDKIN